MVQESEVEGDKALSRRDRNPCPRLTLPSLVIANVSVPSPFRKISYIWISVNIPSSFSSSFASSAAGAAPPAAAPPAAGAAAAPPPDPTFKSRSLTSLPSSAFAKRVAQIGSTSATPAALIMVLILSACRMRAVSHLFIPLNRAG